MEDALKRLDRLTQEEARMAAAQNLKATHSVDERVKGVVDTVEAIDDKVADVDDRVVDVSEQVADISEQVTGVDDRVAGVSEQVTGVDDRVASIKEKVVTVDDRVKEMAGDVDEIRRLSFNLTSTDHVVLLILSGDQLRESTHEWLSPPDPSTNHNIACDTHHKKTAAWFFQGRIYQEWKETGSLLWIHGKRLSVPLSKLTPSDIILSCSWLGQKCYLVRRLYIVSLGD
jgi:archaellum component FlaC